jgi:hypothetical protein
MNSMSPLHSDEGYGAKMKGVLVEHVDEKDYPSPGSDSTEHSLCSSDEFGSYDLDSPEAEMSFTALRLNYLLVTLAVMLADGLQG